jgi:FkbM family methyltransferase
MNLSSISYTSLLGRLLRAPLRLIPNQAQLPILQGNLRGKKWIVGASNHGCWLGSYEYEKSRAFAQTIGKGNVVFDVGANVGYYTLLAAVLVGEQGRVVAFEPVPHNVCYLKEHLRLNAITNVTVFEAAVADRTGEVSFHQGENRSMGHIAEHGEFCVPMVSLDEVVAKGKAPAPHIIKIDVEGAELHVLAGASVILGEQRPTLFLATHGPVVHKQCCHLLGELGYQLQPLDGCSIDATREILAYV